MANTTELIQSLQRRVQTLEDKDALISLLNRYCNIADEKDWEGYARTFAEDGKMTFEEWGTVSGRANIAKAASVEQRFEGLQHSMSNMQFNMDGSDTATGTAYLWFCATPDTKNPGINYAFGGPYKFEFHRGGSGWEITSMKLRKTWAMGQDTEGIFSAS
jgi:hypothetical protein